MVNDVTEADLDDAFEMGAMTYIHQVPAQHKGASTADITERITQIKNAIERLDDLIEAETKKDEHQKTDDDDKPVLPSDSEEEPHPSNTKDEIFLTETGFPLPTGPKRRAYHTWVLDPKK
ncbi:uncharacterized protein CDV56_105498 [Aspergillus thermomutatus]|uniref:Uncharacterized protein n=1 Tax=Aspergillus thermomutatus TaxID=41047 RepID=A0A397GDW3_ASPTH|nr:uncharacterized protein CDV56_105498 [Aspergillus thermomutatus]RHZ49222.1 hypothetical protein CDV56_105498 [Aspergillus thermomutatus]